MKVNPIIIYQAFLENLNVLVQDNQNSLKEIQDYTLSRISKKQIGFEDLSPLLLINYCLNGIKDFKDFSYLVIDEAQDLSLAQYYVLKNYFHLQDLMYLEMLISLFMIINLFMIGMS